MFTCSIILRCLRVAWSIKSRTVHPALQGTTTEVSPKVTVTFMTKNWNNCENSGKNNPSFGGFTTRVPSVRGGVAPVETGATGVSGQDEITVESLLRVFYRETLTSKITRNISFSPDRHDMWAKKRD